MTLEKYYIRNWKTIMIEYTDYLKLDPYCLDRMEKHKYLTKYLKGLSIYHYANCPQYKKIIDAIGIDLSVIEDYADIPFLPVRLFKEYDLKSIQNNEINKTMTSSGTTGQKVSMVYLDRETSANQSRILTQIVSSFIGKKRLPMIILDSPTVLKDKKKFSARGAGILGFSMFGRDKIYALDEDMNLDIAKLCEFLAKYQGENIIVFGFTFMIWECFIKALLRTGEKVDLSNAYLIHGGGWKKLESEKITHEQFKNVLNQICGIQHVMDYYGMVEQTGTIYMECEYGHLHAPIYSDVIVRRKEDFSQADFREEGLLEVVSILPKSYPGHVLLTEDAAVLLGEDDCPCGRKGKYFKVIGRIKNAEIRGCSDTYAGVANR